MEWDYLYAKEYWSYWVGQLLQRVTERMAAPLALSCPFKFVTLASELNTNIAQSQIRPTSASPSPPRITMHATVGIIWVLHSFTARTLEYVFVK